MHPSDVQHSVPTPAPATTPPRGLWTLDSGVRYLNHGAFGACPREILVVQDTFRERLEAEPVRFFLRDYETLLDASRVALASFLGAAPSDLVFVPNATAGVNAVLRSLRFAAGDELLTTDHEYNASRNALDYVASLWGARVVTAPLPWPVPSADALVEAVLARVTSATRLVLVDHVTSPTAVVLPLTQLVPALRERGVETLVDGAHGPGMVPVDLERLGAAYYAGNCHKWMCAPKGCAFLHVRRDLQGSVSPLAISHGRNSQRTDRSQFQLDFAWMGTSEPSALLCLPRVIAFLESRVPGGADGLRKHNRAKALAARAQLCRRLEVEPPTPDVLVGSMAAIPLPPGFPLAPAPPLFLDPLQDRLLFERGIEVPIVAWPRAPHRHIRISAQLYNSPDDYAALGDALAELLS